MKKLLSAITALSCAAILLCASVGCAPVSNEVYALYKDGEYPCTLEAENNFALVTLQEVKAAIAKSERLIVLIGAPWCPYCATDIGPIDAAFETSGLQQKLSTVYYVDAADSFASTQMITELNTEYDWYVRTLMPCLLAIEGTELVADRREERFMENESREAQINAFFTYVAQVF